MTSSSNFDLVERRILEFVCGEGYRIQHYLIREMEFNYINPEEGTIIVLMSPDKKIKILYNEDDYIELESREINKKLIDSFRIFIGIDYPLYGILGVLFFEVFSKDNAKNLIKDFRDYLRKLEKIKIGEIKDNSTSEQQVASEFELFHDKFEKYINNLAIEDIEKLINKIIKNVEKEEYSIKRIKCSDFSEILRASNILYDRELELIISRKELMDFILNYSIGDPQQKFNEMYERIESTFLKILDKDNSIRLTV